MIWFFITLVLLGFVVWVAAVIVDPVQDEDNDELDWLADKWKREFDHQKGILIRQGYTPEVAEQMAAKAIEQGRTFDE